MSPTVTCLLATHGRYRRLRDSLACFLAQTYPHRRLLILNQHPVPISCSVPGVTVLNEDHPTLRDVRFRQLAVADSELVAQWDDDDLYLPHHLETAVDAIGTQAAWKPSPSWFRTGDAYALVKNVMEASWVYRRDVAASYGISDAPDHDEHPLFHCLPAYRLSQSDLGAQTTFVGSWGDGGFHLSGSFGASSKAVRTAAWRAANQDHGSGHPLTPASLSGHWSRLLDHVGQSFPADFPALRARLAMA